MKLADFEAMSFDCYGTLIDWEAGLSSVLVPWARAHGLNLTEEQLLTEYSTLEAAVEAQHPTDLYPDVLARSMRLLGGKLGGLGSGLARVPRLARRAARPERALQADHPVQRRPRIVRRIEPPARRRVHEHPYRAGHRVVQAVAAELRRPHRRGVPSGHRARQAPARGAEPVPRPRSGQTGGASDRVDQPAPRPARLGRHAGAARAGDAGLGVPVHGGARRRRRFELAGLGTR